MINATGKITGTVSGKNRINGTVSGKNRINGTLNANTIKIYPELEDLEIVPSAEEQKFKSNKYGFNNVTVNPVTIKEYYVEGKFLVLVLPDNSNLHIDISSYIDGGLTEEQIQAINNMNISIANNGLIIEYDETVLDLDFSIEDNNLIVTNNVEEIDFNINQNEELEVLY